MKNKYKVFPVKEVTSRFEKAKAHKSTWDTHFKECYKYMMPARNSYDNPQQGANEMKNVHDSTAITSLSNFAGMMQQNLVPPHQKWASYVAGRDIPADQKEALNRELALISDVVMKHIWSSNFDSQVLEMFYDLGISTGAMLIKDTGDINDPITFEAIPLSEIFPEQGPSGTIETVFREWKVRARNITREWPSATISKKLQATIDKNPDEQLSCIEATIYDPESKTFSFHVVIGDDSIYDHGFAVTPWVVPRWDLRAGEVMGRGPAYNVLSDVRELNQVKKLSMQNAEMAVNNIYTIVDDGVVNPYGFDLAPNTFIPVASNGGTELGPSIAALPRSGDFNISNMVISDLQATIREAFYDNVTQREGDPVRSATEVHIMNTKNLQRSGAVIGRLQTEFIDKLMKRVYTILAKYGLVPAAVKVDGKEVGVEIQSPLALARQQGEVQKTLQFYSQLGEMVMNPVIAATMTSDTIAWIGASMGVPREHIPTTDAIEQLKKQMQEAQAAQAQAPQQQ